MKRIELLVDFWGLMILSEIIYRHSSTTIGTVISLGMTAWAGFILYDLHRTPREY